jgi:hypothetical protein
LLLFNYLRILATIQNSSVGVNNSYLYEELLYLLANVH